MNKYICTSSRAIGSKLRYPNGPYGLSEHIVTPVGLRAPLIWLVMECSYTVLANRNTLVALKMPGIILNVDH